MTGWLVGSVAVGVLFAVFGVFAGRRERRAEDGCFGCYCVRYCERDGHRIREGESSHVGSRS